MTTKIARIAALIVFTLGMAVMFFGCASQPGPEAAAAPEASAPLTAISSIAAVETDEGVQVTITADRPLTFSSLKQPDPLAVVLYFPETTAGQAQINRPNSIDMIPLISARQGNGQRTARVEIQLAGDASYTAVQEGNTVQVRFARSAEAAGAKADAAPAVATAAASAEPLSQETAARTSSAQPIVKSSSKAPASGAWVNKIDFLSEAEGKSTLVVGTTHAVDYRLEKVGPRQLQIRLLNTRIPSYRQRPLITTRFTSAVDRIMPTQSSQAKNESIVSIELREAVPYVAEQADNLLMVHFESSSVPPKPLEQANLPDWKRVLSDAETQPLPSSEGALAPIPAPVTAGAPNRAAMPDATPEMMSVADKAQADDAELQSMLGYQRKVFTGEKIALDFYETDIKNVFRILREVSGKNFAIDKDVTGKVTMTLDKPVPWDQVLDLVLRMNQLGMAKEGDIVRIATLETLKAEEDLRKAKLEAYRKAREEVKALEPLITKYIPVSYSNAAGEIQPHIKNILTKDRGSVSVDAKNNQIIITDTAEIVRQAQEIVRRIDKVTAQVVIEARVVEVSDTFSRELGITWDLAFGPDSLGSWEFGTDASMNFPSEGNNDIGISFSRLTGVPFVINARLNALETMGEGRILSSPKILTLDNKKAKIKQGVEYPYLERDSSGGSSVKFKNIDLLLEVTPHVTPDNRISMSIYITKNDVAGITAGVPSVSTNEAETELLVNDGDTIVIGGIIKSSENKGQNSFPGLGRIPLLGWLFKNTTRSTQSNELLIFMTPRIVTLEQATALNP
ncbi:type IV pilus secretin PilQ [Desulfatitalea tepidiphila]|uniref:type IV pilus secretin PilQ n=1 Tax=Desulfatitalea tepidiphila TaxID=1185843 RepID=UPI0006B67C64|nr:AMIN domain-containing protein [Desulfatitalea tepidiphila]